MYRAKQITLAISGSILFTLFFYNNSIGINLLLFNAFVIFSFYYLKNIHLKSFLEIVVFIGVCLSAILVVVNHSEIIIFVNILSLFLLTGILLKPKIRNLIYAGLISVTNILLAQLDFFRSFTQLGNDKSRFKFIFRSIKIFIIPLFIVFLFIIIYKSSNPYFGEYVEAISKKFGSWMTPFLKQINFDLFWIWFIGLLICNFLFFGLANTTISDYEDIGNDQLLDSSPTTNTDSNRNRLQNELRSGTFLFLVLNLLLFIVNGFDIVNVWFGFEWNGNYLKQFVHEGTYLLIFSILISLVITLYYFRGDLNFHSQNSKLKTLAYTWLIQNAVLAISVGIRNFWYIHYFALAYKRIGVIFFLIFIIISIYLVFVKIRKTKSTFFLFSKNALAFYIILLIMSIFNWDLIIARYNFTHYKTAFVHLDFLASMSDKTLPQLIKTPEQLKEIDDKQKTLFHFEETFLDPHEYREIVELKEEEFLAKWESKNWFEWNLAEQRAYNKLK